ncbi:MAG TPA: hypothetical protein ENI92_09985 [Bacteroidetes bacterium]|nr:hypothetical protein [Bacteroidota bacterium]
MAFAPSKRRRLKVQREATVSLNSMMDMMTIILLFLLKSYSTTGALIKPAIPNLPKSTVQTEPKRVLGLILSEQGLFHDVEGEQKPLVTAVDELASEEELIMPSLEAFLLDRQELDRQLGKKVTEEMTLQAADNIPYSWILKVVQTAASVDFIKFDFVVIKTTEGA